MAQPGKQNMFDKLPSELVEMVGVTFALGVETPATVRATWLWDYHGEGAARDANAYFRLTLVNRKFNTIFTPRLYRQLVLRYKEGKKSFLLRTALNTLLCEYITTLLFADSYIQNYFQLEDILRAVPSIETLKLTYWNKSFHPSFDTPIPLKLPRLRTLEILDEGWMRSLSILFPEVLQRPLNKLVVLLAGRIEFEYGSDIYMSVALFTEVKTVHVRAMKDSACNQFLDALSVKNMEELEVSKPSTLVASCGEWLRKGHLEKWKRYLKVFRYRATAVTKDEGIVPGDMENAVEQLEKGLEHCEIIEISPPIRNREDVVILAK